jgi:hypothetical protein
VKQAGGRPSSTVNHATQVMKAAISISNKQQAQQYILNSPRSPISPILDEGELYADIIANSNFTSNNPIKHSSIVGSNKGKKPQRPSTASAAASSNRRRISPIKPKPSLPESPSSPTTAPDELLGQLVQRKRNINNSMQEIAQLASSALNQINSFAQKPQEESKQGELDYNHQLAVEKLNKYGVLMRKSPPTAPSSSANPSNPKKVPQLLQELGIPALSALIPALYGKNQPSADNIVANVTFGVARSRLNVAQNVIDILTNELSTAYNTINTHYSTWREEKQQFELEKLNFHRLIGIYRAKLGGKLTKERPHSLTMYRSSYDAAEDVELFSSEAQSTNNNSEEEQEISCGEQEDQGNDEENEEIEASEEEEEEEEEPVVQPKSHNSTINSNKAHDSSSAAGNKQQAGSNSVALTAPPQSIAAAAKTPPPPAARDRYGKIQPVAPSLTKSNSTTSNPTAKSSSNSDNQNNNNHNKSNDLTVRKSNNLENSIDAGFDEDSLNDLVMQASITSNLQSPSSSKFNSLNSELSAPSRAITAHFASKNNIINNTTVNTSSSAGNSNKPLTVNPTAANSRTALLPLNHSATPKIKAAANNPISSTMQAKLNINPITGTTTISAAATTPNKAAATVTTAKASPSSAKPISKSTVADSASVTQASDLMNTTQLQSVLDALEREDELSVSLTNNHQVDIEETFEVHSAVRKRKANCD